jgi:hypothetical protein
MSDITSIDQTYRLAVNKEIGKFTCLVADTATYADGCKNPGGSNAVFLGVAQESIVPNSVADYSGGQYNITSGTAWPANSIPSSALGRNLRVRQFGISRVVASGAISRGDELNIYGADGTVKTVDETAGTLVYVVGIALDAAGAAGDVIRALIMPYRKKT